MMSNAVREEIRRLGTALNPRMIGDCMAIYGRFLPDSAVSASSIERDVSYGPHERHRLDIFTGADKGDRPVLVYVHGGGFVGGDKRHADTPFYSNIGAWAVRQGFVGVTMTYRLAPAHPWPAGAEDVATAVAWLRRNIANHGGSPRRIFVSGQSAGATHVASYIAMAKLHDAAPAVAGALMFSGLYDVPSMRKGPLELQYYGSDAALAEPQSSLPGLIASDVPMLFTVAEHDPVTFQAQAAILVSRWFAAKQVLPRMLYLPDANHMSAALGMGGTDEFLAPEISAFVNRFSPAA
jgi:acetyl esterase/lipase